MRRFLALGVVAAVCSLAALQTAGQAAQPDFEAALKAPIKVQYFDTRLDDAVTGLEILSHINFEIDRAAVEAATGKKVPEIVLNHGWGDSAPELPLEALLNRLLLPQDLTWTIYDGVILITSVKQERQYLLTRVYQIEHFNDLESLQSVIESTIDPESWRSFGGKIGASAPHPNSNSLVITHTLSTHRRIAKLIDELRPLRAAVLAKEKGM